VFEQRPHYFHTGGLTFQVEAGLPFRPGTFAGSLERFRVPAPGPDTVRIRHHFSLSGPPSGELGPPACIRPPWAVYRWDGRWVYIGVAAGSQSARPPQVGVFNDDHSQGDVYHPDASAFLAGGLADLSLAPGDEDLLAFLLSTRSGCLLQAAGLALDGQGLAFLSHDEGGCPCLLEQVGGEAEVLCDERALIRRWPQGYRLHGAWAQGAGGSAWPASVPLRAVLLLEPASENRLKRVKPEAAAQFLSLFALKPLLGRDCWPLTLDLLAGLARQVPVYRLRFDRGGGVRYLLGDLLAGHTHGL
jgi:hypothetical protein